MIDARDHTTPTALFRVRLDDSTTRLARGDVSGPSELLPDALDLSTLLRGADPDLWSIVAESQGSPIPGGTTVLAPIDGQPVWAAGVTYERSRDGRVEESVDDASAYGRVYHATRPELFYKADGWRVSGPGEPIGIRRDSDWDAPEPELVLVLDARLRIVGFTVGNDVSSRSIEGANPLYLPQAKVYERSCAIGPAIVMASAIALPVTIELEILRDGAHLFAGRISTAAMRRSLDDLVEHLGRAMAFPVGCMLMTGTGIVPPSSITLRPGDVTVVSIGGVGTLRNPVVAVGGDVAPELDARSREA
jgi:2-dehydro-3-deoxy-D-arabinonate dehydratase